MDLNAQDVAAGSCCSWCGVSLGPGRADRDTCSKLCRQRKWRFARHVAPAGQSDSPAPSRGAGAGRRMAFAYADPPYPGCAGYYPEKREVDYGELVSQLERSYRDGWALSLASRDLRDVLPLCPAGVRVGCWVRRVRYVRAAYPLSAWEPVIFCRGRPTCGDRAQRRLDLVEATGRFRALPGACVGMKPPGFCRWVFESLGAVRGDTLADLFPGSGAVTRAWKFYCRAQLEPGERDS